MKKLLLILLSFTLLCGCAETPPPADPVSTTQPTALPAAQPVARPYPTALAVAVDPVEPNETDAAAMAEFSLDLLREDNAGGKNALVSPLSILSALGMTALGAQGDTLTQMEEVMGLLLPRLRAILPALSTKTDAFSLANAIWYHDKHLTLNDAFVTACRDEFSAPMKAGPMDGSTVAEINKFVDETTRGMIRELLKEGDISPTDTAMVLVNALAFEADWQVAYNDKLSFDGNFDGIDAQVRYLCSTEGQYLSGKDATGFIKPYAGERYAFAAILPDEGISLETYLAGLDGESLITMLNSATKEKVDTRLPKFSYDYDIELSSTLAKLGMKNAFDPCIADLSGIGRDKRGNLYIDGVIHKTHIALSETGTEAAAATAVTLAVKSAVATPQIKQVHLTRPFLYAILDTETGCPIFVGTVTNPS